MTQSNNHEEHGSTLKGDTARLNTLLDNIDSAVIELARDGNIIYANQRACSLLGFQVSMDKPIAFVSFMPSATNQQEWNALFSSLNSSTSLPQKKDVQRKILLARELISVSCEITIPAEINGANNTLIVLIKPLDELSKTKQRLENVNRQFKIASESANIGIWNYDCYLNYTEWDEQMYLLYDIERHTFDGSAELWESLVHPDDLSTVTEAFNNCIYKNKPLDTQFRIVLDDGTEKILKAFGYCQLDEFGQPLSVIGVNYDITEQVLLARRAEHDARLKRAILDGANFSIISTDIHGTIQTFNRNASALLGFSEQQVVNIKNPLDFHVDSEINARRSKLTVELPHLSQPLTNFEVLTHKAIKGGVDEREWNYRTANNQLLPIMLSVTSLINSHGELEGFLFIGRNLDEVKRHERESKRTKKLLETTERLAMLGGWEYDIVAREFHGSHGLHDVFGTQGNNPLSINDIISLFATESRQIIRKAVARAIEKGLPWDLKLPFGEQQDGAVWIRTHGHAEFEKGKAVRLKGAFQDISAMKRAEEKAKSASLAKSEFLANMSHELRTPINGIVGMTQLLMRSSLDENQAHYAKLTKMSADSLLTLVNDILDFSKIEAGKLDIEHINVNVVELLEVIKQSFQFKVDETRVPLTLAIDTDVPVNVISDPTRLRQILNNLISNAFKFTTSGEIKVQVQKLDQQLLFSVQDSGIGIPADKVEQLFEKFTQLDNSTTRQYGGSGLGLAISKQLSQLLGGEIGVESVEGRGSLFWFTVKLDTQTLPQNTNQAVVFPDVSDNTPVTALNVLLVEDNYINQQVCIEFLTCMGHHVELASNGLLAIERIKSEHLFDIVLMDCQMPVLDGYQATQMIRDGAAGEHNRDIQIVALTANVMADDQKKCLAAGMNHYLAKPFSIDELSTILQQFAH